MADLAARFAAKEAALKAPGTGIEGMRLQEVETLSKSGEQPIVYLYSKAQSPAKELGLEGPAISLSTARAMLLPPQ